MAKGMAGEVGRVHGGQRARDLLCTAGMLMARRLSVVSSGYGLACRIRDHSRSTAFLRRPLGRGRGGRAALAASEGAPIAPPSPPRGSAGPRAAVSPVGGLGVDSWRIRTGGGGGEKKWGYYVVGDPVGIGNPKFTEKHRKDQI